MPLALNPCFRGDVYVVQCAGRIVAGDEVRILDTALAGAELEFPRMVLNVREVDRVDSSGLGLLVRLAAKVGKRGGAIRLAAPQAFLADLLKLTRLSAVLPAHPTEEDALLAFAGGRSTHAVRQERGPRVLLLDKSPDLCAFIRNVLAQHGFDVQSTHHLGDAKLLLRVDEVDYILLGPDASQFPSDTVLSSLRVLAPRASAWQLPADFNCCDAQQAALVLLHMLGADSRPVSPMPSA
jgi:anti-anti-sigma factor